MKRLIIISWIFLLLFSNLVSAQSVFGSLAQEETKLFSLGPKSYSIIVISLDNNLVQFSLDGIKSRFLKDGESFKFDNGLSVSIDEIIYSSELTINPRVRFYIDVETEACGTARCFPGEKCTNIKYCYNPDNCVNKMGCETYCGNNICDKDEDNICKEDCSFCGNSKCETNELCSTCESDCGCDSGLVCETDSCVKTQVIEKSVVVEKVVQKEVEMNIFQKFLVWLRNIFIK